MAKADVLQRISDLSYAQRDPTTSERYYRDVTFDLARRPAIAPSQITLVATVAGTASYAPPDAAVAILGVFYDDFQLTLATLRELEALNPEWRSERGTPIVYVVEDETERTFRLYQMPEVNSKDFIFLLGVPLGLNFPAFAAGVVHTERRDDLSAWLELPVAFEVLAREFSRDSPHRDPAFAQACRAMADALLKMVI